MSIKYDAREVLYHLNYLGYKHITKEQLKAFMTDLKALIKYETGPKKYSEEVLTETGPCSNNVQRLFESQNMAPRTKQPEKPKDIPTEKQPLRQKPQPKSKEAIDPKTKTRESIVPKTKENADPRTKAAEGQIPMNKENMDPVKVTSRPSRACSANTATSRRRSPVNFTDKPGTLTTAVTAKKKPDQADKENIPAKPKMWIRPRSASQAGRGAVRKTDPVSLYQAYQKDWERFRSNICESSHSDLRWRIREKMMSQH